MSEGIAPREGSEYSITYRTFTGNEQTARGEVVSSNPIPNGWEAVVDGYDSNRYIVQMNDETATVKTPDKNNRHQTVGYGVDDDE